MNQSQAEQDPGAKGLQERSADTTVSPSNAECQIIANPGEYWRWCPRCSQELENHKCKLVCRRCGYFMSCSDFD